MKLSKLLRRSMSLFIVIGLLVGCNVNSTEQTAYQPDTLAEDTAPSEEIASSEEITPGGPHPLSPEECSELADLVAGILGVDVTITEEYFEDYRYDRSGTGCQVSVEGTGVDFPNPVQSILAEALELRSWQEDIYYSADGPGSSLIAFRQPGNLCFLHETSGPSDEVDCPPDQPISACEYTQEQKVVTITLNCAQDSTFLPHPLSPEECSMLADELANLVSVEVTRSEEIFEDLGSKITGTGCQVAATGTGVDIDDPIKVEFALREVLFLRGWLTDQSTIASGPQGQILGYRQADKICLLHESWGPSDEVECPSDQPLYTCDYSPEQQIVNFSLNCAQYGGFLQPPDITSSGLRPLSPEVCGGFAVDMETILGVDVTVVEEPFWDYLTERSGTGCWIHATGTGVDFPDGLAFVNNIGDTLRAQGWEDDWNYAAEGPYESLSGYWLEDSLCLLHAEMLPSIEAGCPPDQPINTCELTPEQQLFTFSLNCAQP